jgi:hypothetical protein
MLISPAQDLLNGQSWFVRCQFDRSYIESLLEFTQQQPRNFQMDIVW